MEKLKVITYNIDGLPESIDLRNLPWILKPICWIYKLIKKTTVISINDDKNKAVNIKLISRFFKESNPDIIAVQEDFNYHSELLSSIYDKYSWGTFTGEFDISKIFSNTEWLSYFPLPRFKADGISIMTNNDTVKLNLETEDIVSWKKSNGYISHANDLITHKGFRLYTVKVNGKYDIDVYIIHMDADFYNSETCPDVVKDVKARKSQLNQLVEYIDNRFNADNPIIIMGDTNSYNKYAWDAENIRYFMECINNLPGLTIKEAIPENYKDCDRIFYINHINALYKLELDKCEFDFSCDGLSDHKPLIAEFNILT